MQTLEAIIYLLPLATVASKHVIWNNPAAEMRVKMKMRMKLTRGEETRIRRLYRSRAGALMVGPGYLSSMRIVS